MSLPTKLIFCFLCNPFWIIGQSNSSEALHALFDSCEQLIVLEEFDSTNAIITPLDAHFKKDSSDHILTARYYLIKSHLAHNLNQNKAAKRMLEQALNMLKDGPDSLHAVTGKVYNKIGLVIGVMGYAREARTYFEKALAIHLLDEGEEGRFTNIARMNLAYKDIYEQNYESAYKHLSRAQKNFTKTLDSNDRLLGSMQAAWGLYYLEKKMGEQALKHYIASLKIYDKSLKKNSLYKERSYQAVGDVYSILGDYKAAEDSYQSALNIRTAIVDSLDSSCSYLYRALGSSFSNQELLDKSIFWYNKAIDVIRRKRGDNFIGLGGIYESLGNSLIQNGQIDQGVKITEKGYNIWVDFLGEDHYLLPNTRNSLAWALLQSEDLEKSAQLYNKNLETRLAKNNNDSYVITSAYQGLSNIRLKQGQFKLAIKNLDLALQSVGYEEGASQDFRSIADIPVLIGILTQYAETYMKIHGSSNLDGLHEVDKKYTAAISLLGDMRQNLSSHESQQYLNEYAYKTLIAPALHCKFMIHTLAPTDENLNEVYQIFEQQKALDLLAAIRKSNIQSFSNIPQNLLDTESELLSNVRIVENEISKLDNDAPPNEVRKIQEQKTKTRKKIPRSY